MIATTHRLAPSATACVSLLASLAGLALSGCGLVSFADPQRLGAGPQSDVQHFADWPMPNATSTAYPNQMNYYPSDTVVTDRITGLEWHAALSTQQMTWQEALDYCAASTVGGHDDWYLPSRIELVSLVNFVANPPTIDQGTFPNSSEDGVWSASAYASSDTPGYAWFNPFNNNGHFVQSIDVASYVRCVRRPQTATPGFRPTYTTVDAASVRDSGTGLIWQRTFTMGSWAQATSDCSVLGANWRVPTVKELQTLFDETIDRAGMSTSTDKDFARVDPVFAGTPAIPFWSSSTVAGFDQPWWLNFGNGNVDHGPTPDVVFGVRCVR